MKAKDKIIQAAEEIFADYHYEHATVKLICDAAGVNIASVNYHFRSKKELYLEVMAKLHGRIHSRVKSLLDLQVTEATQEEWQRFISEVAATFSQLPDDDDVHKWHKIVFRELTNPSEAFDEIYDLYFFPLLNHFSSNLKFFFPELSDHERMMWLITLISQASFIHSSRGLIMKYYGSNFYSPTNLKEYASHYSKNIYNSLVVKPKQ